MIQLREFTCADTDLLMVYLNSSEVTQYMTGAIAQPYTEADAQWWIEQGSITGHVKAIELDGVFVGCISAAVGAFEYSHSAELGYWIGRQYWNKGTATDAVKVFTDLLFTTTDITRLFVSVVADNTASIRVLEKNGYTIEGTHNHASFKGGRYFNEHTFAKIRDDLRFSKA